MAVIDAEENDDNKILVYVKGHEKHEWLADIPDSDDLTIETLDADYEDIYSSHNLDVTNTVRCGKLRILRIVRYTMYLKYTIGDATLEKIYQV